MSKINLQKTIMQQIAAGKITMKPRWYFILGSLLTLVGLVSSVILAVFLTNLTIFLLRRHGPMGQWRLQQILTGFPWWAPVLALLGIISGIWLLKKYDFSYRKNFKLIIIGFLLTIFLSAFIIDNLGLNDLWSRQGPMRRFYLQNRK